MFAKNQPKLIVGNWKQNPLSLQEAQRLCSALSLVSLHEVVICPPTVFLGWVKYPRLGAQDVSAMIKGQHTGEISAAQLKSAGVEFCIVGHSERRALGETSGEINLKIQNLLNYAITPILCVGFDTSVTQDELEVIEVLEGQLKSALSGVDSKKVVIAYEPVWAIGSGKAASFDHASQIALYIKTKFKAQRVLYGGSVKPNNAKHFLFAQHIDGLLLGGSSLLPRDFNEIISLS